MFCLIRRTKGWVRKKKFYLNYFNMPKVCICIVGFRVVKPPIKFKFYNSYNLLVTYTCDFCNSSGHWGLEKSEGEMKHKQGLAPNIHGDISLSKRLGNTNFRERRCSFQSRLDSFLLCHPLSIYFPFFVL